MDSTQNIQGHDGEPRQPDSHGPSRVFRLLHGIVNDLKKLVWQQVDLAIHELNMEADRVVTMVALATSLSILATLCLVFLLLTAVAALHEMAGFSMWMSCGVTALVLMIVAGCVGLYLRRHMQRFQILPIRTLHIVKEDVRWLKEWIASPRT
ncbi:MAG: phage holin family protein [Nitrospira sp.]|nr:phage holin family protein [Nitrospira sp.]